MIRRTRSHVVAKRPHSWVLAVLLASVTLAVVPGPVASAATLYVSPAGNDSNNCLSSDTACKTIGGAVGKAVSGDTIVVAAGTYTENLSLTKNLTLWGVAQPVVDGGRAGPVFDIPGGVTVSIYGLTVQNGAASFPGGGGMRWPCSRSG